MTQDSPSRRQDQFVLRMPDGMRDRIARAASENNRSMNAEIVALLEAHYPPEPGPEEIAENISLYMSMLAYNPTPLARHMLLQNIADARRALEAEAGRAKNLATTSPAFAQKWEALRETFAKLAADESTFVGPQAEEQDKLTETKKPKGSRLITIRKKR